MSHLTGLSELCSSWKSVKKGSGMKWNEKYWLQIPFHQSLDDSPSPMNYEQQ
jgi:hypothetical protein